MYLKSELNHQVIIDAQSLQCLIISFLLYLVLERKFRYLIRFLKDAEAAKPQKFVLM